MNECTELLVNFFGTISRSELNLKINKILFMQTKASSTYK